MKNEPYSMVFVKNSNCASKSLRKQTNSIGSCAHQLTLIIIFSSSRPVYLHGEEKEPQF